MTYENFLEIFDELTSGHYGEWLCEAREHGVLLATTAWALEYGGATEEQADAIGSWAARCENELIDPYDV